MKKENKSADWYFNEISCYFSTEEEIEDILSKIKGKRLVKILLSEIDKFRIHDYKKIGDFGEIFSLYHLNLEIRNIKILKDFTDYRKDIFYFELNDRDNFSKVYFIHLKFLDKLFFQDIKDSDFK